MGVLVLLVLMIAAAALPDFMPSLLSIDRHPPDLWALAALYLALRARGYKAVGWAVLVGIVRDCVSLDPLGTHAFVLGLTAYIFCEGRLARGRLEGGGRALLAGLGVLVAGWIYLLRILPLGGEVVTFGAFVDVFPIALWSAVLAAGLYPILDRFGLLDDLCGRAHAFSS